MPANVSIAVTNSSTNAPIQGAYVFLDGSAVGQGTTDVNGNVSLTISSDGTHLVQITATGLTSNEFSVSVTDAPQNVQQNISLAPNQNLSSVLNFNFTPQVAGILWTLTQSSLQITNGVSLADGTSVTPVSVTYGNYTVNATLDGYQPFNTTITVSGQTSPYTFVLVKNNDPNSIQTGSNTSNSSTGTTQPSSIVSQVTTSAPDQSEYIYPNSEYDKYFTIAGARIYIGNLFIDELASIQYVLQDNAVPIYGYASRYVDAYAQGHSLVQGQLSINFVTEGYLYTVMNEYKKLLGSTQSTAFPINSPNADTIAQLLGMMTTRDNLNQQAQSNPSNTSATTQAAALQTQITALMQGLTSAQVQQLSQLRTTQLNVIPDAVGFDNAIYQDVLFDIRIEMGNEVTGVKRVRYIEKCKLISNEQVIAPDGQSLLDSYGFIGRRLR
jgi:hypothetical protein